ncbi:hypothetical protein TraAM80_04009 [Trypanosoma rangeli]|uniref:Spt4/RpoE2 zinc finger domain-containing protein n=1 Tax=Trypanosoma rangeli TaxID=5698 RepID=A0A3R7MIG2_TRYRA|nr:uncharacterized protein TraAM80_04009 [Trypanosoma rangeli]RNF06505.1 hypothetical protein TraAM80_04009 [Trypanosoma rangeli]|eukprot:RNF06505.1 hypothetical protein TraAM80_04009 [Trypanosoma rangeli]
MAAEPPPQLPIGDRGYLACRQCRLVLTETQFLRDGCSVCGTGPIRREELHDVATADFSNFVGLIAPEKSWVARMIGRTGCPNGVFAAVLNDEDEDDANSDNEEEEEEVMGDGASADEGEGHQGNTPPDSRRGRMPVITDEELLATMND